MRRTPLVLAGVAFALACLVLPSHLMAAGYEIDLAGREFVPDEEILVKDVDSHLVIQFYEPPTPEYRHELAESGILLLEYIPERAWTASIEAEAFGHLDPEKVRAVFELRPEDKISHRVGDAAVARAFIYRDVRNAEETLSEYGDIIGIDENVFTLELNTSVVRLAELDIVKYIDRELPEKAEANDLQRQNVHAEEVQAPPYDLSGEGVTLGIWDSGSASAQHQDYNARLTVGDGSSSSGHGTMCTGIMAGDGFRSEYFGGYPFQWRGMAIRSDIASYNWPTGVSNMSSEHNHAIQNFDIVSSSNSWVWGLCSGGCESYGEYDDWSQNYDKIVRGSQGKRISAVFAAGNDGDCYDCESQIEHFPFGTIPGPGSTSKNTIVVGSNNADNDELSGYSSRGPTKDGRLKPDVAAPGCKSYGGVKTTYTNNDYNDQACGTSFSTPTVSGCIGLIQEDYKDKFGGEAWPSTVKALLIQGAEDKGNVGPDFSFGYGRINVQNSVDIIRADGGAYSFIRPETLTPEEIREFTVTVTDQNVIKVTLVWDDYHSNYLGSDKTLVNDLDLELVSPTGTTHYPWILDPDDPPASATKGVDDLNNVEQVEVDSPEPGSWTIRVKATLMPEPDQDYTLISSLSTTGGDAEPPEVLVLSPNGGEIWPPYSVQQIMWEASDNVAVDHVDIYLSTDGGQTYDYPVRLNEPNSGMFPWIVPNLSAEEAKIKVVAFDTSFLEGSDESDDVFAIAPETSVGESEVPRVLALHQSAPNPFHPSTTVVYDLPRPASVSLYVYDIAGRQVRTLVETVQPAGSYSVAWNGTDGLGRRVGSGVYFFKLVADGRELTRKVVLVD